MSWVICDIEADSLTPTKIWVIVCKDVDTNEVSVFRRPDINPKPFLDYASQVTAWIGHNFLGYDLWAILDLVRGAWIDPKSVIDTLVVSRLLDFSNQGYGHGLADWGERLGYPKLHFNEWEAYDDPELEKDRLQRCETYCIGDVDANHALFRYQKPYLESERWKDALRLEHDMAVLCHDLHVNGFYFNYDEATKLHKEICDELQKLDTDLQSSFPPRAKLVREVNPKTTNAGALRLTDFRWIASENDQQRRESSVLAGSLLPNGRVELSYYDADNPFSLISWEPFNPGSTTQIVDRLNESGWRPYEKTKGHIQAERDGDIERLKKFSLTGWSVSENNLATLPEDAPEAARKLVHRLLIDARRSTLEEWFKAFSASTNRIHGRFNHIGAWTGRMSHSQPNMANAPSSNSKYQNPELKDLAKLYGTQMRSLWTVPKGYALVGVDAESIQLRILAHYMDDSDFTTAIVSGKKEYGTDAHTLNQHKLGTHICKSRDVAKTFIYAWLLGAGIPKISNILGCSLGEAKEGVSSFISSYPGLKFLKEDLIPYDASRGYFDGLDGRAVMCSSEHLMLAGYLQNGESIVMKKANILWAKQLRAENIPFVQVNFVHDEWQTQTLTEYAERVAEIQRDSIRIVGEELKLNCPLAGSSNIGLNWNETH